MYKDWIIKKVQKRINIYMACMLHKPQHSDTPGSSFSYYYFAVFFYIE